MSQGISFLCSPQIPPHSLQFPPPDILKCIYHIQNGKVKDLKEKQTGRNRRATSYKIDILPQIDREQRGRFSKPFTPLLGSHKELLISDARRGRSLCDKRQLEVVDDPVHHSIVGEGGDDAHLALALGT